MGIITGISKIQDTFDSRNSGDRQKTVWFKLSDGQSALIRPLQELDESASGYDSDRGLGFLAVEHQNPANYRNKALCTIDDGDCFACEMQNESPKTGWHQRLKLYVNVLVDDGRNAPYVAVLSQGNGAKSITPTLLEYAVDSGTITNRWFKVSRTGKDVSNTSYTIIARDPSELNFDGKLFDLSECVRDVEYSEQEEHYFRTFEKKEESTAATTSTASTADSWV